MGRGSGGTEVRVVGGFVFWQQEYEPQKFFSICWYSYFLLFPPTFFSSGLLPPNFQDLSLGKTPLGRYWASQQAMSSLPDHLYLHPMDLY